MNESQTEQMSSTPQTPQSRLRFPLGARALLGAVLVLMLASGITYVGHVITNFQSPWWAYFAGIFDVLREANIPTWFASMLWVCLSALAIVTAVLTGRRLGWGFIAAVAAMAAIDEVAQLHEWLDNFGIPMQQALGTNLWFTWVIPGVIIAALVIAIGLPVIWAMPLAQRRLLIAGGVVFLLGAVVIETISGYVLAHFNDQITWHYVGVSMVEEFCEFLGVVLAIGAVAGLHDWRLSKSGLKVRFLGWSQADETVRRARWVPSVATAVSPPSAVSA